MASVQWGAPSSRPPPSATSDGRALASTATSLPAPAGRCGHLPLPPPNPAILPPLRPCRRTSSVSLRGSCGGRRLAATQPPLQLLLSSLPTWPPPMRRIRVPEQLLLPPPPSVFSLRPSLPLCQCRLGERTRRRAESDGHFAPPPVTASSPRSPPPRPSRRRVFGQLPWKCLTRCICECAALKAGAGGGGVSLLRYSHHLHRGLHFILLLC